MSLEARITRDEVSPALAKIGGALRSLGPLLEEVGLKMVSIAQLSFEDASLRVSPWAPKRDGSPATLIQSGLLRASIRVTSISGTTVTVGSDRIYAAIQQLGGTIVPKNQPFLKFKIPGFGWVQMKKVTLPPRPFFPIEPSGQLSSLAQTKIADALTKAIQVYLPGS